MNKFIAFEYESLTFNILNRIYFLLFFVYGYKFLVFWITTFLFLFFPFAIFGMVMFLIFFLFQITVRSKMPKAEIQEKDRQNQPKISWGRIILMFILIVFLVIYWQVVGWMENTIILNFGITNKSFAVIGNTLDFVAIGLSVLLFLFRVKTKQH